MILVFETPNLVLAPRFYNILVRFVCLSFAVTVGVRTGFHDWHCDLAIDLLPPRSFGNVGLGYNVPSCLRNTPHSCFSTRQFSDNRSLLFCNVTTLSAHPSLLENCAGQDTILQQYNRTMQSHNAIHARHSARGYSQETMRTIQSYDICTKQCTQCGPHEAICLRPSARALPRLQGPQRA